jgi:hypothetical protein
MRLGVFGIVLFAMVTFAFGQVADVADSVETTEAAVAQDSAATVEPVAAETTVAEPVLAPETVAEDVATPAPEKPTVAESKPTPDSVSVEEKKSGGLLDELYPVYPDEAISAGHIFGGATLSLIQANTEDDALNVIIGDVYEAEGYMFTVQVFGGYFIKDALAVGTHLGYSRTWLDIDFSLLEDLADVKQHRKYVSNGFFVQPFLKNYLKVMDSKSLYFFNETSILVQYSYGMSQSDDGEEIDKTRNKTWTIKAGLNPGICIMVLSRMAFETSVGLLGLSTSVVDVEENGESHSRLVYNIVNFTINLLALDFSLVYFF